MVRAMADGLVAVVADREPLALDTVRGMIVAVCLRRAPLDEIVEVVAELHDLTRGEVATIVDELVTAGVLVHAAG